MPLPEKTIDLESDILIKDSDGQFKVYDHGQLKDLPAQALDNAIASKTPATQPALPAPENFEDVPKGPSSSGGASFGFHPADQAEIEQELNRLNSMMSAVDNQKQYSVEKISQKLEAKHNLKFSPDDSKKFTKLLLAFFRQARNQVQTRELLLSPKDQGGLGLKPADADDILAVSKHLKDQIENIDGVVIEAANMPTPKKEEAKVVQPDPFVSKEVPKPKPEPKPVLKKQPVVKKEPKKKVVESESLPKVKRPTDNKGGSMDLPKVSRGGSVNSRLVGKVEELAAMELNEFRLLDDDPRMRAAKILQRIEQLGEESVTRKAQGIEAWRSSPVYKAYLRIGQQSLENAQDIKTLVESLSPETSLTVEEFEAITDLNKRLRF